MGIRAPGAAIENEVRAATPRAGIMKLTILIAEEVVGEDNCCGGWLVENVEVMYWRDEEMIFSIANPNPYIIFLASTG